MMRALLRGVSLALGSLKCRNQELTGAGTGSLPGSQAAGRRDPVGTRCRLCAPLGEAAANKSLYRVLALCFAVSTVQSVL